MQTAALIPNDKAEWMSLGINHRHPATGAILYAGLGGTARNGMAHGQFHLLLILYGKIEMNHLLLSVRFLRPDGRYIILIFLKPKQCAAIRRDDIHPCVAFPII